MATSGQWLIQPVDEGAVAVPHREPALAGRGSVRRTRVGQRLCVTRGAGRVDGHPVTVEEFRPPGSG